MRNRLCTLARLEVKGADQGGDPPPGTQSHPLSPSQPERGRFLHFHSVTFWVGNAKQVEAWARPWSGQRAGRREGLGDRGGLQLSL